MIEGQTAVSTDDRTECTDGRMDGRKADGRAGGRTRGKGQISRDGRGFTGDMHCIHGSDLIETGPDGRTVELRVIMLRRPVVCRA